MHAHNTIDFGFCELGDEGVEGHLTEFFAQSVVSGRPVGDDGLGGIDEGVVIEKAGCGLWEEGLDGAGNGELADGGEAVEEEDATRQGAVRKRGYGGCGGCWAVLV